MSSTRRLQRELLDHREGITEAGLVLALDAPEHVRSEDPIAGTSQPVGELPVAVVDGKELLE